MSGCTLRVLGLGLALAATVALPVAAQVSGTAFNDRNGNGLRDAGEEGLQGVPLRAFGRTDAGATFDTSAVTDVNGAFSVAPGNGCYLFDLEDPAGWRRTPARADFRAPGSPGYTPPVGLRRWGGSLQMLDSMKAGTLRYTSMGDSIAWNWNSCLPPETFWYSRQVRDRLRCVAPAATINLDEAAVKGSHTEDLLTDDGSLNNVFGVLRAKPQFVTISIIGNDLLNDEPSANPTQAEINRFASELIDSRQNLQEIVSSLVAGLPGADVALNTLYDNLAYNCATSATHRQWLPMVHHVLREVAWGQARRVTSAEVYADFAHQDLNGGCTGFTDMICNFLFDGIHPKNNGYTTIREKVWESLDGVNLGPKDALGATSITGMDHGYLKRQLRLYPRRSEARAGATLIDGAAASAEDGAGATVRLGIGAEEVRFGGFPDWYDEITPVRVVAGIRYRTTGNVTDDFYRVEASVDGAFRAPAGHAYSPTSWNFFTPVVGTGGPNQPATDPDDPALPVLVVPNVPDWRTVSGTLTKNPVRVGSAAEYEWPALTRAELGTSEIRVAAAPVAATPGDVYDVLVDAVWLDVYGTAKARPPEVQALRVAKTGTAPSLSLVLSFETLAGSELYNAYAGSLASLRTSGTYDHGPAPGRAYCNVPTSPAGGSRLQTTLAPGDVPATDSYFLVTGRADGVESPTGNASNGVERDRSRNLCP